MPSARASPMPSRPEDIRQAVAYPSITNLSRRKVLFLVKEGAPAAFVKTEVKFF